MSTMFASVHPSPTTHNPTLICGCCTKALDEQSVGIECRSCGESICESSKGCIGLCKCDRNVRGFITQMWFRWSNVIYGAFVRQTQRPA